MRESKRPAALPAPGRRVLRYIRPRYLNALSAVALFVSPQTAPDARLSGQSIGVTTLGEVDYSPSAPIA